jgi:protein-tyrosine phosphatase
MDAMKTELYWIEGPWAGRLAMAPRPRGGDWLDDEIAAWRRAGVNTVVSLLTPDEIASLNLSDEQRACASNGLQFVSFPIIDRSVPASKKATLELLKDLFKQLAEGKNIVIHCRQGIGRSALIAIGLLNLSGSEPQTAIERVSASRELPVPETPEQRRWILDLATHPVHSSVL